MMEKLMQESSVLFCLACSFQRKTGDTTYEPNDDPRQTAGNRCDRCVAGLCNGHRGEGRERQATERATGHGNSQRQQRLQRASHLTLKNGSPVVHTVDIADIPADRTRLLLAVKTYWNKYPGFNFLYPTGIEHGIDGV